MPAIKTKTAVAKKQKKNSNKKAPKLKKPKRFPDFIDLLFYFDPKLIMSVRPIFREIQIRIPEYRFKFIKYDNLPGYENQLKIMMALFVPKFNNHSVILKKNYRGSNVPTAADIEEIVGETRRLLSNKYRECLLEL